jgi:RimJ/RimL family protein N-acetyltransferase
VAAATDSTARLNASSFAREGLFVPLILRTYWSAASCTSDSVAGGAKLWSVRMFRHMQTAYAAAMLSSARVRLEPIGPRQARAMLAGTPDPDLPWEDGFPMASVRGALERIVVAAGSGHSLEPFFAYVIVRRADGLAVGDAGFHGPPDEDGEVEIGYALVPAARGAGLASEAICLLVDWASHQRGVRAVTARVDPGNDASRRVLARLGFSADGERGGLQRYVLIPSRGI